MSSTIEKMVERDISRDERNTKRWFHKIEKRHVRILFMVKVCIAVSFFAGYFLPPHHAAWVTGLMNLVWLTEL